MNKSIRKAELKVPANYYRTKGFILRNRDYKEADRLASIFTEEHGKVSAIVRGVKKPKSSLRACSQPFCYSDLYLRESKSLETLTQGEVINFYGKSRENMTSVMYMLYIAEVLDKVLPEREPYPELFKGVIAAAGLIEDYGAHPLWLRYFESLLMNELGFAPVLHECVECGSRENIGKVFSITEGGVLCPHCAARTMEGIFALNPEVFAVLRLLTEGKLTLLLRLKISPEAASRIEKFYEKYMEYHLERRFKLKNGIRSLKALLEP